MVNFQRRLWECSCLGSAETCSESKRVRAGKAISLENTVQSQIIFLKNTEKQCMNFIQNTEFNPETSSSHGMF